MKRRKLLNLIRVLVSILLICLLLFFMRGTYHDLLKIFAKVDVKLFAIAFAIFIVTISAASLRLKWILTAQGIILNLREAVSLTFLGYFFNNFLPTAMGGDVIKAYYASRKSKDKVASFMSVFVDRIIGLMTMVFMAAIALLFAQNLIEDKRIVRVVYSVAAISVLAIALFANKRFMRSFSSALFFLKPLEVHMKKLHTAIHNLRNYKILIVQAFAISFFSQMSFFFCFALLAQSIGTTIAIKEILIRMPLVCATTLIPSINGLGVREGSTVLLFAPVVGKGEAFALSMLVLAILFLTSIIGGTIYALSPQFKMKTKNVEVS